VFCVLNKEESVNMTEDDYSINTNCIVAAVINQRLQKAGFNWQTSPTRNSADNVVITTTLRLCDEFERRFEKDFASMSATFNELELCGDSYTAVLCHLIDGGLNWGRVIAVFSFAGAMSVQCMRSGQEETVDFIREWTCSFLHTKVETWISNNKGWKGMVEFYTNGNPNGKELEKKNWGSLMAVGAMFALGALIVNRA